MHSKNYRDHLPEQPAVDVVLCMEQIPVSMQNNI